LKWSVGGLAWNCYAVATAEEVILSKLRWYRLDGECSEQQWNDVLGVIGTGGI
jgi:hypothetical protein